MVQKGNYTFIDSQNLNLGVRSEGWKIDYRRLRLYLRNKYGVEKAFMFIGMVANNQKLYTALQDAGFILVFKPTIRYIANGKETVKGNVDAELVLYAAAIQYSNYDKAIIVSGDGDFACLVEFLIDNNKLLKLLTPNKKYSNLLAQFDSYIIRIDKIVQSFGYKTSKTNLQNKKDQDWRSVETLGTPDHGDKRSISNHGKKVNKLSLQNKKDQHRRSVETLDLSDHGDTNSLVKNKKKVNKSRTGKGELK